MSTKELATFLVCWALTGCGGVEPQTGGWSFKETITSDTCHVQGSRLGNGGNFGLVDNGDGTFVIDPEDSEARFDCTLDGSDFECPSEVFQKVTESGVAATVTVRVSVEGEFSSSTEASGQRHGTATCEGAACATAEAALGTKFPCKIDTKFDATAD